MGPTVVVYIIALVINMVDIGMSYCGIGNSGRLENSDIGRSYEIPTEITNVGIGR